MVEIPNLVGRTKDQAEAALKNLGLQMDPKYEASTEVENNKVIAVENVGTKVKEGTKVKVTISINSGTSTGTGTGTGNSDGNNNSTE